MSGLYLHIPFCKQSCSYCDFSFTTREQYIDLFINHMIDEITAKGSKNNPLIQHLTKEEPIETLYLGGGTPSRFSEEKLSRVMEALHQHFELSRLCEITIEANPEDITTKWLNGIKRAGINRLSVGLQSFQPDMLDFLHRGHSARQAHDALDRVAKAGFTNFSVDLIYGIPGQSTAAFENDIHQLLRHNPPHISAYILTIEPRTRLGRQKALGRLELLPDETIILQQNLLVGLLTKNGLFRYEISNFACTGSEAIHNSHYWSHRNYFGLGPSAHSFFWPSGSDMAWRWANPTDFHSWRKNGEKGNRCVREKEILQEISSGAAGKDSVSADDNASQSYKEEGFLESLSLRSLAMERLMLGLRTRCGISRKELAERYGYVMPVEIQKKMELFRNKGWLMPEEPLRLTDKGMAISDALIRELI